MDPSPRRTRKLPDFAFTFVPKSTRDYYQKKNRLGIEFSSISGSPPNSQTLTPSPAAMADGAASSVLRVVRPRRRVMPTKEKVYITLSPIRSGLYNPQTMKRSISFFELFKTD